MTVNTALTIGLTVALVVLKVAGVIAWPWFVLLSIGLAPALAKGALWLWVAHKMKQSTRPEIYGSH